MQKIRDTLLNVYQDVCFKTLHPDVQAAVILNIYRIEAITPILAYAQNRLDSMQDAGMLNHGMWRQAPQSRWLWKESDLYDQKVNRGGNSNDPTYSHDPKQKSSRTYIR